MSYWNKNRTLIAIGGMFGGQDLKEVREYLLDKGQWRALPDLPEKMGAAYAPIIKNQLFEISCNYEDR